MNTFDGVEASLKVDVDDLKLRRLKERFPGLKGADELAKMVIPAPDWVLPDFVPVGLSILGGPKKLGKSYLIMQWCKEIVLEGGSVFYFAGEDTHALHKMRQTQMDFPITSDYQYIAGRDDKFASPSDFFPAIEDYLRICRPDAVFIDTMDKAIKPQLMTKYAKDDYAYFRHELDPWSKLAHKNQVAIQMATHSVKNANQIYSDPLDHIHGSTAISATADWILVMQRNRDDSVTLHTDGKMAADRAHAMEKRNGVYLEIAGDLKDIAIKKKSAQDAILNCIRQNPSIRQFEIAAQLERTKQNVNRAVRKLLRDGYITRSADNRYKVVKTL